MHYTNRKSQSLTALSLDIVVLLQCESIHNGNEYVIIMRIRVILKYT